LFGDNSLLLILI